MGFPLMPKWPPDPEVARLRAQVKALTEERDEARAEVERLRAKPCVHELARQFMEGEGPFGVKERTK
jgi:cell division protein FtsB